MSELLSAARVRWSQRLYVRIYAAMLLSLAIAAALFAVAWQMNADSRRIGPSLESFAAFAAEVLPPATASREEQQAALDRWQARSRTDLALYSARRELIAEAGRDLPPLEPSQTTSGWLNGGPPVFAVELPDGRWLVGQRSHHGRRKPPVSYFAALAMIALAVGLGAYPIVRRLTRRLERLQTSVEALGEGHLSTRIPVRGDDEVARLAGSFNRSAARIEALVDAQKALLANASHELRSPLARIRMAAELMSTQAQPEIREELTRNIAELDQLIDEILLASRLDAGADTAPAFESVDLTALVAEECARLHDVDVQFEVQSDRGAIELLGDAKLLRRMLRNLLENAKRYGEGTPVAVTLRMDNMDRIVLRICDGGPGIPPAERERIFEPFYRLPGARERDGGVGLGLALVRQIAQRHGGSVQCIEYAEPGSCFEVALPVSGIASR
ncbi:MAG TPA: HAMP domain-containing sensor histidine kinase [Oxalicibacterium sp.]|nr:HAMP domain-containing sensor histidine kinase [Oxalicibacterium sp.]